MNWQIGLSGEDMDIEVVARLAQIAGHQIYKDAGGRSHLKSEEFSQLLNAREVTTAAKEILAQLNGVARLQIPNHRPVRVTSAVARENAAGGRSYVLVAESAQIRLRESVSVVITHADGSVERRSAGGQSETRAKKIFANPHLREIVAALADDPSWQRLRITYEKVAALVGKRDDALVQHKYATRSEIARFKANAQDPRLSGLDAVHGVARGPLKETQMSVNDGLAFVARLLNTYIDNVK